MVFEMVCCRAYTMLKKYNKIVYITFVGNACATCGSGFLLILIDVRIVTYLSFGVNGVCARGNK